ncbi:E3 SUMO-protein ligase ZNF451 isoform X3 [Patella vulgata]|uniref:E3 SUMO-protein ligase ZNF451 isoform X3 n=1 Tax=Patella vulgata TaxID=6465 RepID=UPI0024A82852|nr:E3 SUMO-protein ligase ZNF451 isoform X3 [Patella vulgata]
MMDKKDDHRPNEVPKFGLLDSIGAVFAQRNQEREERRRIARVKDEVARAHGQYLRQNVVSKDEYDRAGSVVSQWAKKNGIGQETQRLLNRKNKAIPGRERSMKRKRTNPESETPPKTTPRRPLSCDAINRDLQNTVILDQNKRYKAKASATCTTSSSFNSVIRINSDLEISSASVTNENDIVDLTNSPLTIHDSIPSDTFYKCNVINCDLVFDSQPLWKNHEVQGVHSTCNPFLNLINGALSDRPIQYCCPKCEEIFQRKIECQEHMIFDNHLPILLPISLCGYMCPQCCMIFSSIVYCHTHMSKNNHFQTTYQFSGDFQGIESRSVPMPSYLAEQFYQKCSNVGCEVKCIECNVELKTKDEIISHDLDQTRTHQLITTSLSTPEEVFAEFLTDKCCSTCSKIVWNIDAGNGFHQCDDNNLGWLIDHDCKTFIEFVRRCGIKEHFNVISVKESDAQKEDSQPSVSTWVFNSSNQKVESLPNLNCLSQAGPTTRSSDKNSPSKRYLKLSESPTEKVSETRNQSSGESSQSNNSAQESFNFSYPLKPPQNELSNQNMPKDQHLTAKLSKNARKKLRQRLQYEAEKKELALNKPSTSSLKLTCLDSPDTDGDISTKNLSRMHLLIFLDLDNWHGFFKKLPHCLPDKTFVWTFYGGNTIWKPPKSLPFLKLKKAKCFHLHSQCGKTKDASDFAICFTIGKMDDRLPKSVPFAILSGDRGFCEIERQMKNSSRRAVVIDPHEAHKHSDYMIYTMILSVMQS